MTQSFGAVYRCRTPHAHSMHARTHTVHTHTARMHTARMTEASIGFYTKLIHYIRSHKHASNYTL